jgi:8-oxo-dGTP pyrophosphatase MutT (NUDIX family)
MEGLIDWLRNRLTMSLPGESEQLKMISPEAARLRMQPMNNPKLSSVLLLLIPNSQSAWSTYFIKRPVYNGPHSGQISLPGGKMEPCDATLQQTALRETSEELGFATGDIEILGCLSSVQIPISGYLVHPFVGYLSYEPKLKPDLTEVEMVLKADIRFLLDESMKHNYEFSRGDLQFSTPAYNLLGEKLWGATAMMMSEFEALLREFE